MGIQKLLKQIGAVLGIFIVLGYSIFALKGILWGPRIMLNEYLDGLATTTPLITVSGKAVRVTTLLLNDATTTLDLAGNFSEPLLLAPGYNIITLEGSGKYGRSVRQTVEMILLATSTASTTNQF